MADEKEINGRQLKIKGMGEEDGGEKKKDKDDKKIENKIWLAVILVVTVLLSLIFSTRAENGWLSQVFSREEKPVTESVQKEGGSRTGRGLFAPAVHEFEK